MQLKGSAFVSNGTDREILQWLESHIIGTWRGVFTNPWLPPALVEFTFRADRTFSSHCRIPMGCAALYYGKNIGDMRHSGRHGPLVYSLERIP